MRWGIHRSDLRRGVHDNPHLQYAWDKYGEDAFEFMVCEYVEDHEKLIEREQYWFDFHRMLTKVYNYGSMVRHPMLGRKASVESRQKLSAAHKGRNNPFWGKHHTEATRKRMGETRKGNTYNAKPYPSFVHRLTGDVIPAGLNLSALCRKYNLDTSNMQRVAFAGAPHHKGWELLKEQMQLL